MGIHSTLLIDGLSSFFVQRACILHRLLTFLTTSLHTSTVEPDVLMALQLPAAGHLANHFSQLIRNYEESLQAPQHENIGRNVKK